jgi:WD40 repeat protein/flagellar biosynthesis GTPase FlhF
VSILVAAPASPYKGLAPFGDSDLDALLFFGRERESEVIAANLMAARITVLYGPSGVGKSSVLRAGVAHRLRREQEVEIAVFSTWTGDPVGSLIEAVGGIGGSLADALGEAASYAGGDFYLILDQFEECFLYQRGGGRFAEELAEVTRRPGLRVNVLIGIREDALARLDALKAAIPSLLSNRLQLDRLDRAAGEAAILGPIRRYNTLISEANAVEVEPDLVGDVLDEVTTGRVELSVAGRGVVAAGADDNRIEAPYLQLVLARLWEVEAERGSKVLRRSTLRELGGAERIVQDHLERAMAALSPSEKGAAAAMYNYLVTPSGTKIAHGIHDLAGYAALDEREAAAVLQRLSAERIVRASSENGPSTTRYEIYHDVLADAVLGWRTRFEADRRVEEERVAHQRRHRRLLLFGIATLIGLAVTVAVAVYALAERSNANHQAAVAQAEGTTAEQQRNIAVEQTRRAQQKTKEAQTAKAKEQRALEEAQANARLANAAKLEALSQKAAAEGNRKKALVFAAAAEAERGRAETQAALARTERNKAVRARAVESRLRRVGLARELVASAQTLLDNDPEASVRTSLAAEKAFRRAGAAPNISLERTLRDGLFGLRLQAELRTGGPVRSVHLSPDGSLLLVAGRSGARLYDLAHGLRLRRLQPASSLSDAAFSPEGRLVAGAGVGRDHAVHIWDAQTGLPLSALEHPAAVLSVAFSPNGRLIATGCADGNARIWNVATGQLLSPLFTHERGARGDDVRRVAFSPDGSRLLTVGGDKYARIFHVDGSGEVLKLNNLVLVNSAQFSHDGKLVATGGSDRLVRLWDATTGESKGSMEATGPTSELAFSPDDKLLAAAGSVDTTARIWSLPSGNLVGIVAGHRSGVEAVTFSPDSQLVLTTGRDGRVLVSRAEGGFMRATLFGHRAAVSTGAFSPDGETIVTGSDDGSARIWDGRVDPSGPGPPGIPRLVGTHAGEVNTISYSPDGNLLLTAGTDATARIWRRDGSALTLRHAGPVTTASFGRRGQRLITASADGNARIWDARTGALVVALPQGSTLNAAQLSPDGRLAVTAGADGAALIWDVRGRQLQRLDHEAPVNDARFSPNSKLVVTASNDHTAAIWRVSDGRRLATLNGHTEAVDAAIFSPDGRRVATASADTTARIWNVASGHSEHTLSGHSDDVTAITFNPKGSRLATASSDRDARVWNVRSGSQVALLRVHSGPVNDVTFSSDGRWVATAGPLAAGIWETREGSRWPVQPAYLIRGPARPINDVAFSPRGWRLAMGSRDGSVRTFDCRLCGGIKQLARIARARLRAIAHVTP